jgi:hypothetical protein
MVTSLLLTSLIRSVYVNFAPVAQWIRASVFGTEGRRFESVRAYHTYLTIYQAYAKMRAMNNQNKHPNRNVTKLLATGLALTALAGAAKAAPAQAARANVSPSPTAEVTPPAMTAADQELNLKAQQSATALAERVMEVAASHPGSTSVTYEQDIHGNKLAFSTVVIPAGTQFGSNEANYTFTVISPTAPDGTPQLNKVEQLTMSAGASGDSGDDAPAPNIQLGFQMNPATGAWGVSADYSNTLTNATESAVVGIDPVSSTVPRMNATQLSAMFKQGMELVSNAEHGSLIGDFHLPRIFNQSSAPASPAATPNSGGTSAPIETGPGGGTPAS